jgi:Carboxypeptidase regulatory-like domain
MLRSVHAILVFFILASLGTVAYAQNAQIQGQILDASGATIAKAVVRVVDQQTSTERKAEANGSGQYSVTGLTPGLYKIIVEAPGFSTATSDVVTLNVAQNAVLDFKLQIGSASSEIQVNADSVGVNTTDATVSTVVDRQFVDNIPLNGRTFQSLIGVTPGIVTTPTPVAGEQGQFSAAGQRSGSNYFTIDGVSANFAAAVAQYQAQTANGGLPAFSALGSTASLVSIDALQEFRIESSTYAPEYGRVSGAQVVLATRSGTNKFHGAVFNYLRNDALDSTDWFADNTGQMKPRERQNNFGGVFGGPIRRDKTFFLFSYEGLRVTQPLFQISDVPSLASRANAGAATSPLVNAYPLPNGPDTDPGLSQLATSSPNNGTLDATSLRIDHTVNSRFALFGRFSYSPSSIHEVYTGYPGSNPFTTSETILAGTLGLTTALSPTMTNEFRFNYSRAHGTQHAFFDAFGGAAVPSNSFIWSPIQNPQTANSFFAVETGRNVDFSIGRFGDNVNRQTNVTDTFSVTRGNHLMKFGFDYRRLRPDQGPPSSFLIYDWIAATSLISGAIPDGEYLDQDRSDIRQLYHNFSAFAQDSWKMSRRLNLTYGIRWEYNPPPTEVNGAANAPFTLSQVTDLSTATLLPQGSPLWHADWKNFAPRLGMAYQLGSNQDRPLVLRVGFGQFFDLGTDTAPFLNNAEGWFPYSLTTVLCQSGVGPYCNNQIPYAGAAPPFDPTQGSGNSMRAFDPHLKLPYSLEWDVALEKAISQRQTVKLTYLGALGRRMLRDDVAANTNPTTNDMFGTIYVTRNNAYANYNALQVQFQRRLSRGLEALVSYSWAHSLDINSSDITYESPDISSTIYNIHQDYGSSDYDIRHSFSAALTYNIPTFATQNWLVKSVMSDWAVNSNSLARTGVPFNAVYTPATPGEFTNGTGAPFLFRPNQDPTQATWISDSTAPGGKKLNPDAFSIPATLMQGTEGRNNIHGFPLVEMDLGVRRQFNLIEGVNLQFRAEAFNIINHPNFNNPFFNIGTCKLGTACPPQFGFGESQAMLNQGLGSSNFHGTPLNALYQIGGPRSLQVSLKLQF